MGWEKIKTYVEEDNDFYATEPKATELLLRVEKFTHKILEPCCGAGHIGKVLEARGHEVIGYDLIPRGYGEVKDAFSLTEFDGDVITNPPYKIAQDLIFHLLHIMKPSQKLAMFLKLQFVEGLKRRKLFDIHPVKTIYVSSARLNCAKNGDFEKYPVSAIAFAWFIWEKDWYGETILRWL
jgi:hypothetical protein